MSKFRIRPQFKGGDGVATPAKYADTDEQVERIAEQFFSSQKDEADPRFVRGVAIDVRQPDYFNNGSYHPSWAFDRYMENPAIDPFEGL